MRKSILTALFTTSFFTILDRVLGFVFKIYLSRELGAEAIGVYQVALSFFFVLLTATTSGIPLIVSKYTARFDEKNANGITTAALIVGTGVSVLIIAVVLLLYKPLSAVFTSSESASLLLFMLPALLFSAIYSAFRGNLWGKSKFFAVSIVEVVEQIGRMLACFILFTLGLNKLSVTAFSLSIGCFVSMLGVSVYYFISKGRLASPKGHFAPLISSALPITISRAASSIIGSINALLVPFLLTSSGLSSAQAMSEYGSSVGLAIPLLYAPLTIVGSLAFVLIPSLSKSISEGQKDIASKKIQNALAFSIILAALFVPVLDACGEGIGLLVYDNLGAGLYIKYASWTLIPLAIESITSSVMNSLDLEMRSFINYIIGSAVTFAVMFLFFGAFNTSVLAFSTGLGLSVSAILHIHAISKKIGFSFAWLKKLLFCALIIIPTRFITACVYSLCSAMPLFFALLISAIVSVFFFLTLSLLFGIIDIPFAFLVKRKKNSKLTAKTLAKKTS